MDKKPEKQSASAQISASLVNFVNPRLSRYSNAGIVAFLVVACQIGIIVGLTIMEQGNCATTTNTEKSWPNIYGINKVQLEFMAFHLKKNGVVRWFTWHKARLRSPAAALISLFFTNDIIRFFKVTGCLGALVAN